MGTFRDVWKQLVSNANSKVGQGKAFERLMQTLFREAPEWKMRFSQVWLWGEWPDRDGPDTGIDLVAKEADGEGYCAIQCKAYASEHTLQKGDIDSFFTASGKHPFTGRVIVSTAGSWSQTAEKALEKQQIPVQRLDFHDLEHAEFYWPDLAAPEKLRYTGIRKQLRPHQTTAVEEVVQGFEHADRGQLIMACGTGKTFTALKIAERIAGATGAGGRVLYLVPSIALISQSMREWARDQSKALPHRYVAVCSDRSAGRSGRPAEHEDASLTELVYPPQTNPNKLAAELQKPVGNALQVVFSTYHSLAIVQQAQQHSKQAFDLVICDEAHRTTGVDVSGTGGNAGGTTDKVKAFTLVHDQTAILASKRLYMTATPRLYSPNAKKKAERDERLVSSMDNPKDNPKCYGEEFHRLDFSTAIEQNLLTDYKVLILIVDQNSLAGQMTKFMGSEEGLGLDDTAKLIGCWNALAKRVDSKLNTNETNFGNDTQPMRRAVAFANTIENSKKIAANFKELVDDYHGSQPLPQPVELACELQHVDGTMGAVKRNAALNWLRDADIDEGACRIVSNVRCLSEGVDVPVLDAVIFTQPRASQVDVVQSVGRVMRKAPGKQYGYVILPIAVNASDDPTAVLHNNKAYRVVWEVLQALRSHDNRFNALINKLDLNQASPPQIQVIGVGGNSANRDSDPATDVAKKQFHLLIHYGIQQWREALFATIVKQCGDRHYWEDWVTDVADISQRNIARIKALVHSGTAEHRNLFNEFMSELKQNLNPAISEADAIAMLAQHAITKPVFDALFEGYQFTDRNPVSCNIDALLKLLEEQHFERETKALQGFYDSVRQHAKGIDNPAGRQRILMELYEKFFAKAFKRDADRLGIVFTPVEIVDFILHSANYALRQHFGEGLTDQGVHILDPFVGTGTFIARLLQSDLIAATDLERKYREELHANELVLLSYYIAAVNIEETYHQRTQGDYVPFPGIVLTDTFQINEHDGKLPYYIFTENPQRHRQQKTTPIRVIIGNPPYSGGQKSQNDDNPNLKYTKLDKRIAATYAKRSTAILKKGLYDSYIRALRWASDRIGDRGVVAFVTNGSFIDSHSADGLRQCLAEEYSQLYIYNLRGNQRTAGEISRKEGGQTFGQGSRLPVAITLLVKDQQHQGAAEIYYHDIGDYLTREQKLAAITHAEHIGNIPWQRITPNAAGDWINQRNPEFEEYLPLGLKDNKRKNATSEPSVFHIFSNGVTTNRDAWVYNSSKEAVKANMTRMIGFYNQQVENTQNLFKTDNPAIMDRDATQISWSHNLEQDCTKGKPLAFNETEIRQSLYRPFYKQYLYFDRRLNERVYLQPRLFPQADSVNRAICVNGTGASKAFSALIVDVVPNLHFLDSSQCFPRYTYEPAVAGVGDTLLASQAADDKASVTLVRQDNIPQATLENFQEHYADKNITRDAIFDYIYGILHSPAYRERYANDLRKMLPRVPFAPDFWAFSGAGQKLAALHLNYETLAEYQLEEHRSGNSLPITKMRFGGTPRKPDRSCIICNAHLTLRGIPEAAYDYQVNGKSAIEGIIDRYQLSTHKDSGIVNDPYSADAPDRIPSLLKRIVTMSLESVAIVKALSTIR